MDLLGQHSVVQLETKGDRGPVSFSKAAQGTHAAAMFPALDIEPPILFSTITKQRAKPITTKSRYASKENQEYLTQEIDRLLEAGIIEPSSSPWRAQAFVVRRGSKPRMVIDYSETINRYTEPDGYPFPEVETILDGAAQDKYFSRVDLKSAYHQVPIQESDRSFTAFEANGALYQFTRLAFGLTNAVPVFQRVIDSIIRKEKLEKTRAYLDDVIISGATQEEHDRNLERFISTVKKYGITLNKDKCLFNVHRISLLGHILEKGTKRPDPERLKTLMNYPLPATKQELHRLIGFFAYNAKWIAHYSDKVRPLLDAFNAGLLPLPESAVKAIGKLKDAIAKSVLAVPKPGSPLFMTTDASGTAIGGTLTQDSQPIAFFSRSLSSGERKQSAAEREALAIVECSLKWMPYMRTYHTLIQTDQEAVAFIFSRNKSKVKNDKLIRWRLELSTLSYGIEYKKGSENIAADALSRIASIDNSGTVDNLHRRLCHPGITRMWEYVSRHKLPFTLNEVRQSCSECPTCLEWKPKFYRPEKAHIIKATRPFERISIDLVGPKSMSPAGNRYLLTVIDEYSRFPFAIPLKDIFAQSVIRSLKSIFSLCGTPGFIHSDRGHSLCQLTSINSAPIRVSHTPEPHRITPKATANVSALMERFGRASSVHSILAVCNPIGGEIYCLMCWRQSQHSFVHLHRKHLTSGFLVSNAGLLPNGISLHGWRRVTPCMSRVLFATKATL